MKMVIPVQPRQSHGPGIPPHLRMVSQHLLKRLLTWELSGQRLGSAPFLDLRFSGAQYRFLTKDTAPWQPFHNGSKATEKTVLSYPQIVRAANCQNYLVLAEKGKWLPQFLSNSIYFFR